MKKKHASHIALHYDPTSFFMAVFIMFITIVLMATQIRAADIDWVESGSGSDFDREFTTTWDDASKTVATGCNSGEIVRFNITSLPWMKNVDWYMYINNQWEPAKASEAADGTVFCRFRFNAPGMVGTLIKAEVKNSGTVRFTVLVSGECGSSNFHADIIETPWTTHSSQIFSGTSIFYKFGVVSGTTCIFKTGCGDGATANFNTKITLYNSSCQQVAFNDDACESTQSLIKYKAPYNDYYYLKVTGYSASHFGNYTLAFSPMPQIKGTILNPLGDGIGGVSVSANNGGETGVTNADGEYNITVPIGGWSGRVTPSCSCIMAFEPPYRDYALESWQNIIYSQDYTCVLPDTPSNISASKGTYETKIRVTWGNVSDETGYKIYRATSSGGTYSKIGEVGTNVTSYDDPRNCDGTKYYYKISAYNFCGETSLSSYDDGYTKDCEGEGEVPVEGEGEIVIEGEGETPVEGEGEAVEGEGELGPPHLLNCPESAIFSQPADTLVTDFFSSNSGEGTLPLDSLIIDSGSDPLLIEDDVYLSDDIYGVHWWGVYYDADGLACWDASGAFAISLLTWNTSTNLYDVVCQWNNVVPTREPANFSVTTDEGDLPVYSFNAELDSPCLSLTGESVYINIRNLPGKEGKAEGCRFGWLATNQGEDDHFIIIGEEEPEIIAGNLTVCLTTGEMEGEGEIPVEGEGEVVVEDDCVRYQPDPSHLPIALVCSGTIESSFEIETEGRILDVNVLLDISCSSTSSLVVKLQAPSGDMITLFSEVDNNGQDFNNTGLDDEGAYDVHLGFPPFSGTYIPGQPLSTFDGQSITGMWQLYITDLTSSSGTLNSWSLCLKTAPEPEEGEMVAEGEVVNGSLRGVVRKEGTIEVLSDTEVQLLPGNYTATSNTLGIFSFLEVPVGDYALTATRSDYEKYTSTITIDGGITVHDIDLVPIETEGELLPEGEGEVPTEGEGESPPPTGSLAVTIEPSTARTDGAQWRVDNGSWHVSGFTQSNISEGSHVVSFKDISGWNTPGVKWVSITAGKTTSTSGTYTEIPSLSMFPVNQTVLYKSGVTSFNVSNIGNGTMNWTAKVTSGNWLRITSGTSGTNSGVIEIAYDQNNSTSGRTGEITITAPGVSGSPKTVTVIQNGEPDNDSGCTCFKSLKTNPLEQIKKQFADWLVVGLSMIVLFYLSRTR